ncbi:MAG TPA: hypothetical protein VK982_11140 [Bacteroidales bacterium]|nr:hypothetical protein [Bacteroidales bacterium]
MYFILIPSQSVYIKGRKFSKGRHLVIYSLIDKIKSDKETEVKQTDNSDMFLIESEDFNLLIHKKELKKLQSNNKRNGKTNSVV